MKKEAVPRAEDKKRVVLRALLEEPEGGLEESASEAVKSWPRRTKISPFA